MSEPIEYMSFVVYVDGKSQHVQGYRLKTLSNSAKLVVCDRTDNDKSKKITWGKMKDLDPTVVDPNDYWWIARGGGNSYDGGNTTWRVNLNDIQPLVPLLPMGSLTITPNDSTWDIDSEITLVANTTGGPADEFYWDEIDSQVFEIVNDDWTSQTLKLKPGRTESNSVVRCTATQYNAGITETVSATATVSITENVLYPGPGGDINNPLSRCYFGNLYKGMAVKDGYKYILGMGGDGNHGQIVVLDNKKGSLVNYKHGSFGSDLGGGFWFERYFYRLAKGSSNVNMYRHADEVYSNTDWDTNWVSVQTLAKPIAAQAFHSAYGVCVGKKDTTGAYYYMSPGNKTFNTRTFSGAPLASKQIWCVCTSADGTTVVTDSQGSVYVMDSPTDQGTAKKKGTWHQGAVEDAGGVDVAFDNNGTWMVAKRRSYSDGNIGGGIMRSKDNGQTWESLKDRNSLIVGEKHCSSVAYGDGVWMATFSEAPWQSGVCLVAKSTDNGDSWTSIYANPKPGGQPPHYMSGVRYAGNGKWIVWRLDYPREALFF